MHKTAWPVRNYYIMTGPEIKQFIGYCFAEILPTQINPTPPKQNRTITLRNRFPVLDDNLFRITVETQVYVTNYYSVEFIYNIAKQP